MLYTRPFLALALANFCISSSGGAFFLFPLFVLDRGGSAADIGVVMAAFTLASTLCRPWVAARIDRLGRKRGMARTTVLFVRGQGQAAATGGRPLGLAPVSRTTR